MKVVMIGAVTFVLACGLAAPVGTAYAARAGVQASQPGGAGGHAAPLIMTFVGEVLHQNGKYVLQESMGETIFQLDDQAKVKPFEGRKVVVTGTLDAASDTIHISNIKPDNA